MTNAAAARSAELVVLATNAEAALATAEQLREAIGDKPLLCVASGLHFTRARCPFCMQCLSLAERVQRVVESPVVAGLHSLAARSLGAEQVPEEDALVCGDDEAAKSLALELAVGSPRPGGRRQPAASAGARGADRGAREREQALLGSRRHHALRPPVSPRFTILWASAGIPELARGTIWRALVAESAVYRWRAARRRHRRGRGRRSRRSRARSSPST